MAEERVLRRLAAILVADVVGYSRLMEADEVGTLAALKKRRTLILQPTMREYGGRIVKFLGDGVLIEFASAVNAVTAAIELQRKMSEANADLPDQSRIVLRVGINLGDVIGEGADIYGEGVNIAARLEALAEPGGICISGKVHDEVRRNVEAAFEDVGERQLKTLRNPSSERLQGRMREMVKVISAATELTGDVKKAIYWYRNEPIADYGHRTAAELVAGGQVEAVLAFIRDLENGARG